MIPRMVAKSVPVLFFNTICILHFVDDSIGPNFHCLHNPSQAHFLQRVCPDHISSSTSLPSHDLEKFIDSNTHFSHSCILCYENIYTVVLYYYLNVYCYLAVKYASLSSLSRL